jgi:hypothetical protein
LTTVHDQFVGTADETVYGTPVAPANFYEFLTDGISGAYERIEAEGIRGPVLRADRFAPNPKGAAGDFEVEVLDKGFDFWLLHMLGAVSVDGTTQAVTAVPGETHGKSFSYHAARYASGTDSLIPFAYSGGKVTEWELTAEVDGILKAKATCDFATEYIDGKAGSGSAVPEAALAVAAYPSDAQLLTFIGGSVTVGGSGFPVSQISVTGNNGLKVDRYAMRGANSTTKREPKEEAMKEFGFSLTGEFEDTSHSERVASLLATGALATVVLHFDSPQGGTLDISLPAGRFDEGPVNAAREVTTQELTGKALQPVDGTDAIQVVYTPAA